MDGKVAELVAYSRAVYVDHPKVLRGDIDTIQDIIEFVVAERGVDINDILGKKRIREVVVERQLVMAVCRIYAIRFHKGWTLEMIGEAVGGKNHVTVLHSMKMVSRMLEFNDALLGDVDDLLFKLGLDEFDMRVNESKGMWV